MSTKDNKTDENVETSGDSKRYLPFTEILFGAQTIAVGLGGYKYIVKPAREMGTSLDDSIFAVKDAAESLKGAGQTVKDKVIDIIPGFDPQLNPSEIQDTLNSMVYAVNNEKANADNVTKTNLQSQLNNIKLLERRVDSYLASNANIKKNLTDAKYSYMESQKALAKAGEKVVPGGPTEKIYNSIYKTITGEGEHKQVNFEAKVELYTQLDKLEDMSDQAIRHIIKDYNQDLADGANAFEARESSINGMSDVLTVHQNVIIAKTWLNNTEENTFTTKEQSIYETQLETIATTAVNATKSLEPYDVQKPSHADIFGMLFPIAATLIGVFAYKKIVDVEAKIFKFGRYGKSLYKSFMGKKEE